MGFDKILMAGFVLFLSFTFPMDTVQADTYILKVYNVHYGMAMQYCPTNVCLIYNNK